MKHDKKLDQSLKNLDKDIIWSKDRQQHVRNKLIDHMRQDKTTRVSRRRKRSRRLLPAFSIVFMIAIVTIIALSEINTINTATSGDISQRTSGATGVDRPQIVLKDNDTQNTVEKDYATDDQQTNDPNNNDTDAINDDEDLTSHDNENIEDTPSDTNDASDRLLTQSEIMEAIKGQMTSDLPLKLPTEISLPEGKHLTAVTSADTNSYEVIFYQHDEPIPINNKQLFSDDNPAEVIARVHVHKYDTQEAADDAVSHETFDEEMGEPIKLSTGLTGYQDAGAGSTWTSWNVGRWALTTHARSDDSERGVSLAKDVIAYLDEYMLPAPQQHGYAHLDAEHEDNRVVWEEETTVYTVDQTNDPLQALEITVNFE